jgi:hypothetical protein
VSNRERIEGSREKCNPLVDYFHYAGLLKIKWKVENETAAPEDLSTAKLTADSLLLTAFFTQLLPLQSPDCQ